MAILVLFVIAALFLPVILVFSPLAVAVLRLFKPSRSAKTADRELATGKGSSREIASSTPTCNRLSHLNGSFPSKNNGKVISANGHIEMTPSVALFVQALRSRSAVARRHAAIQLGRLGALAAPAIPALKIAASDKNKKVRRVARQVLHQIRQQEPKKSSFWNRFFQALGRALSVPHT